MPTDFPRIAYEAYGKTTDFKNYQGLPMPTYDDLPEKIKLAWEAATKAVYEATLAYKDNSY